MVDVSAARARREPRGARAARAWVPRRRGEDKFVPGARHTMPSDPAATLTVLITTSPIPSAPSTALLETLLCSLDQVAALRTCPVIVVFDGIGAVIEHDAPPNYKRSRIHAEHARAYGEYKQNARALLAAQRRHIRTLELTTWHGCALATRAALEQVQTPLVMLLQHDQVLLRDFDAQGLLDAMCAHPAMLRYVALPSRTTLRYAERVRERFGLELPEPRVLPELGTPLLPLLMWFDKPHLTWAAHLRTLYETTPFAPGSFVEDVVGRAQLDWLQEELARTARVGDQVVQSC